MPLNCRHGQAEQGETGSGLGGSGASGPKCVVPDMGGMMDRWCQPNANKPPGYSSSDRNQDASPGARGSSHLGKSLITSTASNARTSPWGMGNYLLRLRAKYIQYTTPFTTTTTAPSVTWMAVVKPAGYNTLVM